MTRGVRFPRRHNDNLETRLTFSASLKPRSSRQPEIYLQSVMDVCKGD